MQNLEAIEAQIAELQAQAAQIRNSARRDVMKQIHDLMQQYQISIDDLGKGGARQKRGSVEPKYRNPATGATWSGRGRQPRWLAEAIEGGQTLEAFAL